MRVIAITGASGFIGQHLMNLLCNRRDVQMRVLVHLNCDNHMLNKPNVVPVKGDLMRPETLEVFLEPGCTVVNLVYLASQSKQDNLVAMGNLADACVKAQIRRLVHCSTAQVVGRAPNDEVTEETQCNPQNEYEVVKLEIEKLLLEKSLHHFELVILRPTAVFGPEGKNLLKLADDLVHHGRILNYFKSCLSDHRSMNLVCVENVVAAIAFLIETGQRVDRETFIISDDENPMNNYRDIEQYFIRSFGYRGYPLPLVSAPMFLLATALKVTGKSNVNPRRVYSSKKLINAGFEKAISFKAGLASFADWYKSQLLDIHTSDS